jgi:molybdopterin-guanine dinucleotide biosynthesis protein A
MTERRERGTVVPSQVDAAAFSAIVVAGGQSSRMGQPKAILRFGKHTLLERIVAELQPSFSEVIVVAAPEEIARFDLRVVKGVKIVRDEVAFAGPLVALGRGLAAAQRDIAFVCSCDLPMLMARLAHALCEMIGDYDAVIPDVGGIAQPLCAAYRKRCASAIALLVGRGEDPFV